jgi:hypothetical protein
VDRIVARDAAGKVDDVTDVVTVAEGQKGIAVWAPIIPSPPVARITGLPRSADA